MKSKILSELEKLYSELPAGEVNSVHFRKTSAKIKILELKLEDERDKRTYFFTLLSVIIGGLISFLTTKYL